MIKFISFFIFLNLGEKFALLKEEKRGKEGGRKKEKEVTQTY